MNDKAQAVEAKVTELYESKDPNRDGWADWLWENHVKWVADKATEIAEAKGFNKDLCRIAALLHDIADVEMKRSDPGHQEKSLEIARDILTQAGYDTDTTNRIVDDALLKHSCHDDIRPISDEGKVLATADALAHLYTTFLPHAVWEWGKRGEDYEDTRIWAGHKVEKDFNNKILFEDIKEQARPAYETLRKVFGA